MINNSTDDVSISINLAQCEFNGYDGSYRYLLPYNINFDPNGGYQVRLDKIHISDDVVNTRNCSMIFTRINPPTDPLIKIMPIRAVYKPSRFLKLLNGLFEDNDVKEYFGLNVDGPAPLQYTITEDTGVATLKMKARFDLENFNIDFSQDLAVKLGYDRRRITDLPYESPNLMNLNYNQEYFILLADIVESSLFNQEFLPILYSGAFKTDTKMSSPNESAFISSVRKKEYGSDIYRSIKNYSLGAINFRLVHETMDPIMFASTITVPNILINLQLRRQLLTIY